MSGDKVLVALGWAFIPSAAICLLAASSPFEVPNRLRVVIGGAAMLSMAVFLLVVTS